MPTESLSNICNQSLDESKAENLIILDVRTVSSFADEIIIEPAGLLPPNIMKQEQREFYDLESLWGEMMPSKESI